MINKPKHLSYSHTTIFFLFFFTSLATVWVAKTKTSNEFGSWATALIDRPMDRWMYAKARAEQVEDRTLSFNLSDWCLLQVKDEKYNIIVTVNRRSQCQFNLQPENTSLRKAMNMIMPNNRCFPRIPQRHLVCPDSQEVKNRQNFLHLCLSHLCRKTSCPKPLNINAKYTTSTANYNKKMLKDPAEQYNRRHIYSLSGRSILQHLCYYVWWLHNEQSLHLRKLFREAQRAQNIFKQQIRLYQGPER